MIDLIRPTMHDRYQIKQLKALGCSDTDIAKILRITPKRLSDWQRKDPDIAEVLKEKPRPECTIHYPDYAPNVEEVFTCAGRRYYRFKEEYEMPAGRYKYFYAFLREIEMHCSLETLKKYVDAFEKILNGGKKGISLGDLWKLVWNLKTIIELDFDPQLVKKLASVAYFDETEDLSTYDSEYGEKKIQVWDEHQVRDFFLTKPIGELLGLKNISLESLETLLNQRMSILKELDLSLQTVSKENS